MAALEKLEACKANPSPDDLEDVLTDLEMAYRSITEQRNWLFDPRRAAQIELEVILGNRKGASFETVAERMVELYELIFESDSPSVLKAAMLRTFLYQYRNRILQVQKKLSQQDQDLLLAIDSASKSFLESLAKMQSQI